MENEAGRKRVLVVEDDVDAAESMRELLALSGCIVAVATDGPSAVEQAKTFLPEVVLCDIRLPSPMSGYDVARALVQAGGSTSGRLVALTGYGEGADVKRAREAGFDVHLRKPVDPALLLRVIRET